MLLLEVSFPFILIGSFSKFFTIELEITGNPDSVISLIGKSMNRDTELFEGAKVNKFLKLSAINYIFY